MRGDPSPAVCADARTLVNLTGEIARAYRARHNGGRAHQEAPDDALQYIEFSEWRHSLLAEPDAEAGLAHWRRQLDAGCGPPVLPLELSPPAPGPFAPGAVEVPLPPALRALLAARAGAWEVSPSDVLMAAWAAMLQRLAGSAEVTLHVRLDGRKFPELQGALGLFEQLLPLTPRRRPPRRPCPLSPRCAARAVADAPTVWQEYFVAAEPGERTGLPVAFEPLAEEPGPWAAETPRFTLARRVSHCAPFKLKLAAAAEAATLWYDGRGFDAAEAGRLAGRWAAPVCRTAWNASTRRSLEPDPAQPRGELPSGAGGVERFQRTAVPCRHPRPPPLRGPGRPHAGSPGRVLRRPRPQLPGAR